MLREYQFTKKGYIPVLRSIVALLNKNNFNLSNLGAYILFISQMDWDKRHEYYGAIIRSDAVIAKATGYTESAIYKQRKLLVDCGLLVCKDDTTYIKNIGMFEMVIIKAIKTKGYENIEEFFYKTKEELESFLFDL